MGGSAGGDGSRVVADAEATQELCAAQEGSGAAEPQFLHPDGNAAVSGSQRIRPLPPDARPASWWGRNQERIFLVELGLTGVFVLLALYFLFRWVTFVPEVAYAVDREGFRAALLALPPPAPDPAWRVAADPGRWRQIVVHHTAGTRGSVASIDRYHREENKWPNGMGYHFLIGNGDGMGDGEVAAGPRWEKQLDGAHVRMKGTAKGNSFSIGVALVGNFETRTPSVRQLAALRSLLAFLVEEYGIPVSSIAGHGEVSEKVTACPGKGVWVEEVAGALL